MKKNRGMILFCTLAILVILSVFLMVVVHRTQSSLLVTKRVMWDVKSYWAAIAGNNVAADSCIDSKNFPNSSDIPFHENANYGGYTIKLEDGVVKGEDTSSESYFTINYKNNITGSSDNKCYGLSTSLQSHFDSTDAENGEIYCLTVGKSFGPTVCGTEFIYNVNYAPNTTFDTNLTNETMTNEQATFVGAALYVAGDLDINVKDYFTILQKDGTRGCIVSGGNVTINSEHNNQPPTWEKSGGLSIGNGSVFAGRSCKINNTNIPLGDSSNFTNYGVSVYQKPNGNISAINDNAFKDLNGIDVPSGIWAFMEMPSHTDPNKPLSGLRENEFKALCNAVNAICPTNAETTDTSQIGKFESYLDKNPNYRTWLNCDTYTKEDSTDAQKAYVASKFNQVFDKLSELDGKYVPVFLPDKDRYDTPFATRAKLSPSSINSITYSGMIKAIANGVISENKVESETINLPLNSNTYVINTCRDKNGANFYLLRANDNNTLKSRIDTVGQNVSFSAPTAPNEYLTMNVNGNLESKDRDSFFSFAVFERNPENFSSTYQDYLKTAGESDEIYNDYAINQLAQQAEECFVPANDRRGRVQLGNGTNDDNSIVVNKMHIKGAIIGKGSLRAKEKDITFEGVGSGVSSGDSLVSMWAKDDIKIYQASASHLFTSDTDSSANFRGILYAHDKIRINVGSDNLNFNLSGVIITTKTSSGDGFLEVHGIKNFTITYDPDISGEVLEKYISGWQAMTESLGGSGGSGTGSGTNTNLNSELPKPSFKAFNRI